MRLFVGVPLPDAVKERLQTFLDRARPLARAAWSHAVDAHVTTKFVGDVADVDAAAVERSLAAMEARPAFPATVRDVGWFPNVRAPRVFWARVEAPPDLAALAAATDDAVSSAGVARDVRPYVPHVTLARVHRSTNLDGLHRLLAESPPVDFGSFDVDRFALFEVRPGGGAGRYHAIATFPLSRT